MFDKLDYYRNYFLTLTLVPDFFSRKCAFFLARLAIQSGWQLRTAARVWHKQQEIHRTLRYLVNCYTACQATCIVISETSRSVTFVWATYTAKRQPTGAFNSPRTLRARVLRESIVLGNVSCTQNMYKPCTQNMYKPCMQSLYKPCTQNMCKPCTQPTHRQLRHKQW